jgi:hypothetical protein
MTGGLVLGWHRPRPDRRKGPHHASDEYRLTVFNCERYLEECLQSLLAGRRVTDPRARRDPPEREVREPPRIHRDRPSPGLPLPRPAGPDHDVAPALYRTNVRATYLLTSS